MESAQIKFISADKTRVIATLGNALNLNSKIQKITAVKKLMNKAGPEISPNARIVANAICQKVASAPSECNSSPKTCLA